MLRACWTPCGDAPFFSRGPRCSPSMPVRARTREPSPAASRGCLAQVTRRPPCQRWILEVLHPRRGGLHRRRRRAADPGRRTRPGARWRPASPCSSIASSPAPTATPTRWYMQRALAATAPRNRDTRADSRRRPLPRRDQGDRRHLPPVIRRQGLQPRSPGRSAGRRADGSGEGKGQDRRLGPHADRDRGRARKTRSSPCCCRTRSKASSPIRSTAAIATWPAGS